MESLREPTKTARFQEFFFAHIARAVTGEVSHSELDFYYRPS